VGTIRPKLNNTKRLALAVELAVAERLTNEVIMRSIIVVGIIIGVSLSAASLAGAQGAAAARPQTVVGGRVVNPSEASINGTVMSPTGQPLTDTVVQARNLLTGAVEGSTTTAPGGQFSIVGLDPGSYVVEIVDAGGQIIGTSSFIAATAGATIAATVTATSGALTAVSTVTGLAATLTTTAAETVKFAAAAAGVAGVVAPPDVPTASPSR
jgi:hypothetical protein